MSDPMFRGTSFCTVFVTILVIACIGILIISMFTQ